MSDASERWGLTPGEKRAVIILIAAVLIGTGYRIIQRALLPASISISVEDSLAIEAIRGAWEGKKQPAKSTEEADGLTTARLIDINTANQSLLESLPGVGPVIASRIVELRDTRGGFQSAEELLDVPGIGPVKLERIKPLICCEKPINEK